MSGEDDPSGPELMRQWRAARRQESAWRHGLQDDPSLEGDLLRAWLVGAVSRVRPSVVWVGAPLSEGLRAAVEARGLVFFRAEFGMTVLELVQWMTWAPRPAAGWFVPVPSDFDEEGVCRCGCGMWRAIPGRLP